MLCGKSVGPPNLLWCTQTTHIPACSMVSTGTAETNPAKDVNCTNVHIHQCFPQSSQERTDNMTTSNKLMHSSDFISSGGEGGEHLVPYSLLPRPSPTPFSWPHMWSLNRPEKWEKAWYIFYIIKLQGGLDHDGCGLSFSNYGNVPTRQIAIDSKQHKTTLLLFQFIATTQKTAP